MSGEPFPKITVVTPSLNQAEYLESTILSVIGQEYPNLEYIIIDGGSTDGSVDIIKKYQKHLSYWISEPDKGLYDAVQKGFEKSSGDIMAWLNSDDMYHARSLFVVADIFNAFPGIYWLQGNPSFFDEANNIIGCNGIKRWSKYDFYTGNYRWIQQESTFWRRELWDEAGSYINTALKYAGDFELWLRFFRYRQLYVTQALLAGYRLRSGHQLALIYEKQYHEEAVAALKREKLTSTTIKMRNRYQRILTGCKLLEKAKFIYAKRFVDYFRKRHLGLPPNIAFDRKTQKFFLTKNA